SDAEAAEMLLHYELEIGAADDPATAAPLRIEAGRLAESLGDLVHARRHYEAALAGDPRAAAALRGLRRIARAGGDVVELARLVDAEIAIAEGRERCALLRYCID